MEAIKDKPEESQQSLGTFCAYCNCKFIDGRQKCPCGRQTRPLTPDHLKRNVLLLSGTGAARIWDTDPVYVPDPEYTEEEMRRDLEDDPLPDKAGNDA